MRNENVFKQLACQFCLNLFCIWVHTRTSGWGGKGLGGIGMEWLRSMEIINIFPGIQNACLLIVNLEEDGIFK